MTTASARVLEALPEDDATLLAHLEEDYLQNKSRRQCSRRDFMDGYLAAAKRFATPMTPRVRVPRSTKPPLVAVP